MGRRQQVAVIGHRPPAGNELRIATAWRGGPPKPAGLAAGDVLLAIDGLRVTPGNEQLLQRQQPGDGQQASGRRTADRLRLAEPPAGRIGWWWVGRRKYAAEWLAGRMMSDALTSGAPMGYDAAPCTFANANPF